jgi:hypothetical protein
LCNVMATWWVADGRYAMDRHDMTITDGKYSRLIQYGAVLTLRYEQMCMMRARLSVLGISTDTLSFKPGQEVVVPVLPDTTTIPVAWVDGGDTKPSWYLFAYTPTEVESA